MGFNTPTIEIIASRMEGDLKKSLDKHGLQMSELLAKIFSTSLAGAFYSFYDSLDFLYRQISPLTAEEYNLHLFGNPRGLEQAIGQRAVISVEITTIDDKPTENEIVIGKDSVLKIIKDLERQYKTIAEARIPLGKSKTTISCVCTKEGTIGNLEDGAELSFEQTPKDISEKVKVSKTVVKGTETQRLSEYRDLVVKAMENKERGNEEDYIRWVIQSEADLTRVWMKRKFTNPDDKKRIFIYVVDDDKLNTIVEKSTYKVKDIKNILLDTTEKKRINDYLSTKAPVLDKYREIVNPKLRPLKIKIVPERPDDLSNEDKMKVFRKINKYILKLNLDESAYQTQISSIVQQTIGDHNFTIEILTKLDEVDKYELIILESIEWP